MRTLSKAILVGLVGAGLLPGTFSAAVAQPAYTDPTYFEVSGVAPDDVLNVRARPTTSAEIVGELAPGARPVEVLRMQDGWAMVSSADGTGWAYAGFLEPIEMATVGGTAMPASMSCGGTEPFWGLEFGTDSVTYSAVDSDERDMSVVEAGGMSGMQPVVHYLIAAGETGGMTAIVNNQMCSDGMSSRTYPRRIDMVLSGPGGNTGLTGCCHVPVN